MKKDTKGKKKLIQKYRDLFQNKVFLGKLDKIDELPPEERHAATLKLSSEYNLDMEGLTPFGDFYNLRKVNKNSFRFTDMCKIVEHGYWMKWHSEPPKNYEELGAKNYPVGIRINKEASQADVVDFIKKNWTEIEITLRGGIAAPRLRQREKAERDKFIWGNKEKPTKEIIELVYKKFREILGEEEIYNIKSLERKRRSIK